MGLFQRLIRVAKANMYDRTEAIRDYIGRSSDILDDLLDELENEASKKDSAREFRYQNDPPPKSPYADYPAQVIEDLATFELKPPSSLKEVKQARNREIKKYHSDKFVKDPEKFNISKEIMQKYNDAYTRLRKYYEAKETGK